MVIRTDICTFSELRIWPGRGTRFVSKDSRVHFFLSKKARALALRKVKAQNITWTTAWRRANKKGKNDEINKKRKKRVVKVQREIYGVSLEQLNRTRNAKPSEKKAQAEKVLREIKDRKAKQVDAKRKAAPKAVQKQQQKQKATKNVKGGKK